MQNPVLEDIFSINFAVFKLITGSYSVEAWTGRSGRFFPGERDRHERPVSDFSRSISPPSRTRIQL